MNILQINDFKKNFGKFTPLIFIFLFLAFLSLTTQCNRQNSSGKSADEIAVDSIITAYKNRQHDYQEQNNISEAYRTALERINYAKSLNDSAQIREAIFDVGRLLFNQGMHHESLEYFLQSANICPTADSRATLYYALGQVQSMTESGDNYKESIIRYYELAEKETQKPDFTKTVIKSKILFGKANLLIPYENVDLYEFHPLTSPRKDSLNTAISLLKEALHIAPEEPIYYAAIALCYAYLEQFPQAHQYEEKAFEWATKNQQDIRQVNYVRAIVRYREKNFKEAIEYAASNVESYLAFDDLSDANLNIHVVYYAYKTTSNTEKALQVLEQMKELNDRKIKKEKQKQVIIREIQYNTQLKDEEIREMNRKNKEIHFRSVAFGTVGIVFIILSVILYRLYVKKQKAYRELVRKSQEWAHVSTAILKNTDSANFTEMEEVSQNNLPNEIDMDIIKQIEQLMNEKEIYKDPELSLDSLALLLNIKRNRVSMAINRCTKKNINTFINEYRIKNVICLLSKANRHTFSIEGAAYDSGFNAPRTFYRVFKEMTGLTPSEFINNIE